MAWKGVIINCFERAVFVVAWRNEIGCTDPSMMLLLLIPSLASSHTPGPALRPLPPQVPPLHSRPLVISPASVSTAWLWRGLGRHICNANYPCLDTHTHYCAKESAWGWGQIHALWIVAECNKEFLKEIQTQVLFPTSILVRDAVIFQ